jgi:hypothetical protein
MSRTYKNEASIWQALQSTVNTTLRNIYSITSTVNNNFMVYTPTLSVAQIVYAKCWKIRKRVNNKLEIKSKDVVEA